MIPTTGLEVTVVKQAERASEEVPVDERDETRDTGSRGDEEWTGAGGVTGDVFIDGIRMSRWLARESRRRMPMQHRVNKARAQTAGRSRALHDLLPQGWPWSRLLQGDRDCCKESEPDPRPFLIAGFLAVFGNFWHSRASIPVASLDKNTSAGPVR